jgi:hypothetical protein
MSDNTVKIKKQTIDPTLTLEDVKKQLIEKGKKEGHLIIHLIRVDIEILKFFSNFFMT